MRKGNIDKTTKRNFQIHYRNHAKNHLKNKSTN